MDRPDFFCVGIPVYNEAKTIGRLVHQLRTLDAHVIVLDNSSEDDTVAVADHYGAEVRSRPYQPWAATAYLNLIQHSPARYMITMDAGGTHIPEGALALFSCRHAADLILAQRQFHGLCKRRLLSLAASLPFRSYDIYDATCGLRCYDTQALDRIDFPWPYPLASKGHIFQAELLWMLLYRGLSTYTCRIPYALDGQTNIQPREIKEALFITINLIRKGLGL